MSWGIRGAVLLEHRVRVVIDHEHTVTFDLDPDPVPILAGEHRCRGTGFARDPTRQLPAVPRGNPASFPRRDVVEDPDPRGHDQPFVAVAVFTAGVSTVTVVADGTASAGSRRAL